jgi:hypothetical protein
VIALWQEGNFQGQPMMSSDGCPYYQHDPAIFYGVHDRMRELSPAPATFRGSPDVVHMLGCCPTAVDLGYRIVCDKTLPPNSLLLGDGD